MPDPGPHPLSRHEAEAHHVLAEGDPQEIKRLYVRLGTYFQQAQLDSVPVLSLPGTAPAVMKLLDEVKASTQGIALDAGCGPNPALAIALARSGRPTVAMDIGAGTVATALGQAERVGCHLAGVVGDLERLPFRDRALACVTCEDTIEHVPDDATAAAELARVTQLAGYVVIATPNRASAGVVRHRLLDRLRGRNRPPSDYFVSVSHLREYTFGELESIMAPYFHIVGRTGVGWDQIPAVAPISRLVAKLATTLATTSVGARLGRMVVLAGSPRLVASNPPPGT
jgi:SAM-dependent methyltransferase